MELLATVKDVKALHNFELIHCGKSYGINRYLLSAVSPKFMRMILAEPGLASLNIPNIDGNLNEFVDILYGKQIRIHINNCRFLNFLARFFEIEKLEVATKEIYNKTATVAELISHLEDLVANAQECDDLAHRLAMNIDLIEKSDSWRNASVALVEKVLKQLDENKRCDMICKMVSAEPMKWGPLLKLASRQVMKKIMSLPTADLNMCIPQLYAYVTSS